MAAEVQCRDAVSVAEVAGAAEAISAGAVTAQSCGGGSSAAHTQACEGGIASARAFRCGPGRELGRDHAASAVAEVVEVVAAAAVAEAVAEVAEAAAQSCDGESSTCPMDEIASSRAFGRPLGREHGAAVPGGAHVTLIASDVALVLVVMEVTLPLPIRPHATATWIVTVSGVGDTAGATCLWSGHES